MRIALCAALLAALTACGDFKLYGSAREAAGAECQSLGLMFGTEAFANCYERSLARRQASGDALSSALIRANSE